MKVISCTLLFAAVSFISCAPKTYDRLSWQKTDVAVDGSLSEWSNPLKYFDAKSKLNFSITNDRKNLYICIKAADDQSQVKILRGGMDFFIDTTSKKTFPIAVSFPLPRAERPKSKEERESREEQRSEQSDISKKQAAIENCRDLKLTGFPLPQAERIPLENPYGIKAALAIDKNDVMVYELVIPFKTFYREELLPADTNVVFSYQIRVRGIASLHNNVNSSGGGSRGGGGGGGMGGGGGGMGGGMGAGGGMRGGGGGRQGGGAAYTANPLAENDLVQFKAKFSYR